MGRVRTKIVKKTARIIVEQRYTQLTSDFHHNKKICDVAAIIPSKRLRNQIAGYATYLLKRIAKGPVRGISIKLQEEERERRDNYMPEVSEVDPQKVEVLNVDSDTMGMLYALGLSIPNVDVIQAQ